MKAQVEKVESRADNVTKLAITVQPEATPDNIIKWQWQDVEVIRTDSEMVSIPKAEYLSLTSGDNFTIPHEFILKLATLGEVLGTAIAIISDLKDSAKKR